MARTATRPIPSGRVGRGAAAAFASALLLAGTALLWLVSPTAAWLGLGAAVVYNRIYTPLKRVTPFAALPGALIGALPPAMGWVAAGGYLQDPSIHLVAFFFFLWQIPHFWLLLLFYGQDYREGGLPSLLDRFDHAQMLRLTFLWIAAVSVAALLLPLTPLFDRPWLAYVLAGAGALLVWRALPLLKLAGPAAGGRRGAGAVPARLPDAFHGDQHLRAAGVRAAVDRCAAGDRALSAVRHRSRGSSPVSRGDPPPNQPCRRK